jgi:3',5'-cyclic-AMP phosphodiesterase
MKEGILVMERVFRSFFLTVIFLFLSIPNLSADANKRLHTNQPTLQFPVISDVHICGDPRRIDGKLICQNQRDDKFKTALEDIQTVAPNHKAIAIVGDLTNHGLDIQYDKFMDLLFWAGNPEVARILSIGNHEFFENKYWYRPQLTNEMLMNRFVQKTYMDGIYYDKWIEGYHFIALGSEGMFPPYYNSAYISERQFTWLEATLKHGATPNKPIFVFLHQPIRNTVYGSQSLYGDHAGEMLKRILKKYPQVILFSGHSHYRLDHPRTVHHEGFTMVNTGAIYYIADEYQKNMELSQGLIVDVFKDRVDIKAREFSNGTWIKTYSIKLGISNPSRHHSKKKQRAH